MQIQTTKILFYTHMIKTSKSDNAKVWINWKPLSMAGGSERKWVSANHWGTRVFSREAEHFSLPKALAGPLLGTPSRKTLTHVPLRDTHKNVHKLCCKSKTMGTTQMPANSRLGKLWCFHSMEDYARVKTSQLYRHKKWFFRTQCWRNKVSQRGHMEVKTI